MDYKGYEQQFRPEDELGSWFLIPDPHILLKKSSRRFSSNWNKVRRVVLAIRSDPGAILFPRSTTGESGYHHERHQHVANRRCDIDMDGRVVLNEPVTVRSSLLDETSFSCIEPDDTGLLERIRQSIEARP